MMARRASAWVLAGLVLGLVAFAVTAVASSLGVVADRPAVERRADLVARLGLTDLALFTEARYTRHPSQSDRHAAFQDHPFAFEHFPSGSVLPPRRSP